MVEEDKKKAIDGYCQWILEKDKDKIIKLAIEMWLICPDVEYWTEERMNELINGS